MEIQNLRLAGFRAHAESRLRFGPKINLIHGSNGSGKTNILEAVHYLCLSKSFLVSSDQYALRKGSPFFEIEAGFTGVSRKDLRIRLVYVPSEGKHLYVNKAPLERLAQIVGLVPIVVFSPSDQALTAEGPEYRRRFVDNILSQARPVYLDDLMSYRRILRQRNVLLMQYRKSKVLPRDVLTSWDAELIRLGSRVVVARLRFIRLFREYLDRAFTMISSMNERPGMKYQTLAPFDESEEDMEVVAGVFEKKLASVSRRELDQGRSLIGPHRDELIFRLNDLEVRRYASQGQHQTFGMALKLAQYFYLRAQLNEPPILLLDDLFGNLDSHRTGIFLELLQSESVGQSLITAAQFEPFQPWVEFDGKAHHAIKIRSGKVVEE